MSQTDSTFLPEKSAETGIAKAAFEYVGRVSALRGLPLFLAGCGIIFVFISILWLHWSLRGSSVGSLPPLAGLVPPCFHADSCVFPHESDLENVYATRSAVDLISLPDGFVSARAKADWKNIQRKNNRDELAPAIVRSEMSRLAASSTNHADQSLARFRTKSSAPNLGQPFAHR